MSPKWGRNPFCHAPIRTSGQQSRNLWPVAFTANQILDAYYNWQAIEFNITCAQDVLDAQIEITQAMSYMNMGQLLALDVALGPIFGSAAERTFITGTMQRRTDSSVCNGVKFVYSQNLAHLEMSFGPVMDDNGDITFPGVVRVGIGNSYLYNPRFVLVWYASGYMLTNDLTLLYGAGTVMGGIDVVGSSGVIGGGLSGNDIYAATASGPPVGSPSLFGEMSCPVRIDEIVIDPKSGPPGTTVEIDGINFEGLTAVEFGGAAAQFEISGDNQTVTADSPAGATFDPIKLTFPQQEIFTRENFQPTAS